MAKMTEEEKRAHIKATIKGRAEPEINPLTYRQDLLHYLNYHNTASEDKHRRAWVMYGMQRMERDDELPILERVTDFELHEIGPLMHARDRDMYLTNEHLSFIDNELDRLMAKYKDKKVAADTKPAGPTAEEKADATATSLYGEDIQNQVDLYIIGRVSDFSMKSYLITNNVSTLAAQKIALKLAPTVIEIREAYEGKDEQLVEGYSNWKRPELRKFLAFLQELLEDCMEHGQVVKAMRKPRVSKKPKKSPVAKLKYLASHMELNMRSVNPETILGADELYAYRTNRKFIYYKAKAGETLQIAGQTILNYDEELSGSKTIRKPNEFFANFNTGKKAIKDSFNNINSSKGAAPARIGEDVVLLKVF